MEAISPQESSLLPGGFAPSDLAWLHLADCRKATFKAIQCADYASGR